MTKPSKEIEEKSYFKDVYFLYEIIHSFKNTDELKRFLKDILTRSELRMLKRRWHIATLLNEGLDIRTVASKSKTSTQTVERIKKILEEGYGGLTTALGRRGGNIKPKENNSYIKGSKFIKR